MARDSRLALKTGLAEIVVDGVDRGEIGEGLAAITSHHLDVDDARLAVHAVPPRAPTPRACRGWCWSCLYPFILADSHARAAPDSLAIAYACPWSSDLM